MIDSGYSYSPEKLIIPGMLKLGLDPSEIKYILITHAGPDHVGGLSYIAPVYTNGEKHMWATYGNTNVVGTLEDKLVYRDAVAHFLSYTEAINVDVIISNHPFVDGSLDRMDELRNNTDFIQNPFIVGEEYVTKFLILLDQCAAVLIAREQAGLDETGTAKMIN